MSVAWPAVLESGAHGLVNTQMSQGHAGPCVRLPEALIEWRFRGRPWAQHLCALACRISNTPPARSYYYTRISQRRL